MSMTSYQALCLEAIAITRQAGAFLQQELGKVQGQSIEEKSFNQLVSYVDRQAEEFLVSGLGRLLPDSTFLTEEATIAAQDSPWQWIIDPLDGTTNFLHGVPVFAVSVALKHQHEIVIGIVQEVNRQECFYAWQGGGAWCNEARIRVRDNAALSKALLATGFPTSDFENLAQYVQALSYFMQRTRGVRRLGAASVDLAYVACGRFDAFFEYNLQPWDVAAGALLVTEAGGVVTDFSGGSDYLFGKTMLATSSALYPALRAPIQAMLA